MQQNPRPSVLPQSLRIFTFWVCGALSALLAAGIACGQSPGKASLGSVSANSEPAGSELAQNAEVPASPAQVLQQDEVQILALATEVHTEVSHNSRDLLLLDVVRKAEEIRRLAGELKHEIKLTSRRK